MTCSAVKPVTQFPSPRNVRNVVKIPVPKKSVRTRVPSKKKSASHPSAPGWISTLLLPAPSSSPPAPGSAKITYQLICSTQKQKDLLLATGKQCIAKTGYGYCHFNTLGIKKLHALLLPVIAPPRGGVDNPSTPTHRNYRSPFPLKKKKQKIFVYSIYICI